MSKTLKSLLVHFAKKLRQEREKITKTNKNQVKSEQSKPKLKVKQPVKQWHTHTKKKMSKKERNVDKQK